MALALGDGEFVVGLGEVIHADELVAASGETINRHVEDFQLFLRPRQGGGVDVLFLHRLQPGHIGKVEHRNPVRIQAQGFLNGVLERGQILVGQTVDQVYIDAFKPSFP